MRAVRHDVRHVVTNVLALPHHAGRGLVDPRADLLVLIRDAIAEFLRRVGHALMKRRQSRGEPERDAGPDAGARHEANREPVVPMALLSMFVLLGVGILFILQNALANTLVQLASPDRLRGRVMSVYSLVFQGMQGAGRMQAGLTETFMGAPLSVAVGALMSLVYGIFVFFKWPEIRRMK